MYLNLNTLTQCTERDIREAFPNTSFIEPFSPPDGYVWVFPTPAPAYDPITQFVREIAPELTALGHYEQRFEVVDLDAETIAVNQAAQATKDREAAKQARQTAVDNIKVTTASGRTFDGDETSQTRLTRAILVLSTGFATHVPWVLADNTVIQADIAELTEALALAGQAQAALWVI